MIKLILNVSVLCNINKEENATIEENYKEVDQASNSLNVDLLYFTVCLYDHSRKTIFNSNLMKNLFCSTTQKRRKKSEVKPFCKVGGTNVVDS